MYYLLKYIMFVYEGDYSEASSTTLQVRMACSIYVIIVLTVDVHVHLAHK